MGKTELIRYAPTLLIGLGLAVAAAWRSALTPGVALFLVTTSIWMLIRAHYETDRLPVLASRRIWRECVLVIFVGVGMLYLPAFAIAKPFLDFASCPAPLWLLVFGTVLALCGMWLFWRSHADLGKNWSPVLELRERHGLVTGGVYARILHPMYAAIILIACAQAAFLGSWVVGPAGLITFTLLYLDRIGTEERMMAERFEGTGRAMRCAPGGCFRRQTGRIATNPHSRRCSMGPDFVQFSLTPILIGILSAIACALPGNFLPLRRQALIGDAISHVVLPDIVVAFIVTGMITAVPMLIGAAGAAIVAVILIEAIKRLGNIERSAAMGVVLTSMFAAGVLILEQADTSQIHLDVEHALMGNLESLIWFRVDGWHSLFDPIALASLPQELTRIALVCALVIVLMLIFWRWLKIATFDESFVQALGIPAAALGLGLVVTAAVATLAAFDAVGSIIVIAMFICPPGGRAPDDQPA